MIKKITATLLFVFFVFMLPAISFAQPIGGAAISLSKTPLSPNPGERVVLELSSFSTDLRRSEITWRTNGETLLSGIGEKVLEVKAGDPGQIQKINITVITQNGNVTELNTNISPSHLDILWEAPDSYTPPFYKGKALPSQEAPVKFVAFSQNNEDLVYTWKKSASGGAVETGLNRNSVTINRSFTELETQVFLGASNINKTVSLSGSVSVDSFQPEIVFYKYSPLNGISYNKSLKSGGLVDENVLIINAEPYFFSSDGIKNLNYLWEINGNEIETPENKRRVNLSLSQLPGSVDISLEIEHLEKTFQEMVNAITINI